MKGSDFLYRDKYITRLADAGYFPHDSIIKMKPHDFRKMNIGRLTKRSYEKAEEESTPEYEFKTLIRDFLNKCTVSVVKSHLLDGASYYDEETKEVEIRIHKLMEYLKANRDFRPMKKVCFDLRHLLQATKVSGYVKNNFGKEKSCPTWRFKESRENFIVTLTPEQEQIEDKKDEEN
tara:strand:- start:38 stop:568 length:531 start_codon:yes stop_codon:yes gene_type:complete